MFKQEMDELFTYMAQRDDAKGAGNDAEFNYWRGYIDATADMEGWTDDLAEIEAAYQRMLTWAAESMDAASEYGRKSSAASGTRKSNGGQPQQLAESGLAAVLAKIERRAPRNAAKREP